MPENSNEFGTKCPACGKTILVTAPSALQRPEVGSTDGLDAREKVALVESSEDVNYILAGVAATLRVREEDASFQPTTSFLQRRLRLGWVKASQILPIVKRRADEESASNVRLTD